MVEHTVRTLKSDESQQTGLTHRQSVGRSVGIASQGAEILHTTRTSDCPDSQPLSGSNGVSPSPSLVNGN